MRTFCSLCMMLVLCSTPVAARDIFVDNVGGDDRASGLQLEKTLDMNGPVQTIAKALGLAGNGDTIVLTKTDQPYRESISLVGSRASGIARQPFTICGNGAILDGSAPVPVDAWRNHAGSVFQFRPPQMGSPQLFLDDRPAARVVGESKSKGLPELQPKQWCLIDGEIYFCVEKTKLPSDYKLSYTHLPTGITLFHVDHVRIEELTVQGFYLDGIQLQNSARNVSLVGVTCRGNGRSGVAVGGASVVDISRSLLGNNGEAQLLTLPYSETHVRGSHLLANTAPGWVDRGGRVYMGDRRMEGGLDEYHAEATEEKQP